MEGTVSYLCEADGEESDFPNMEEEIPSATTSEEEEKSGICCVEFNAAKFADDLEVEKSFLSSSALRSHKCLRTEQETCPSGYVKVADHMAFLDKFINCDVHKTEEECNSFEDTCVWKKGLLTGGTCTPIENFCCTYYMKKDVKYECLRETCDADLSQEQCCVTPKPKSRTLMNTMKETLGMGGPCSVGRCDLGEGTASVGKTNEDAFKKEGCCRFFLEKKGARQGYCSDASDCEPLVTRCCVREPEEANEPTTCSVLDVYNTKGVNENCPTGFRVIEDPEMANKCCSFFSSDGLMLGPCGDDACVSSSSPVSQFASYETSPPVDPPKVFSVKAHDASDTELADLINNPDTKVSSVQEEEEQGEGESSSSVQEQEEAPADNNKKRESVEGVMNPPEM